MAFQALPCLFVNRKRLYQVFHNLELQQREVTTARKEFTTFGRDLL